jgi:N6-adenosine-specific RNA methylase IME4
MEFPQKKYNIIYADPPWRYHGNGRDDLAGGVEAHYPTMDVRDICALDIASLAHKNCLLFLWVTFPCLKEGLQVIEAWGFEYVTLGFSWIKTYENGQPFFGIGHYTKSNCEVCLLGRKGNSLKISDSVSSVVISKLREHSRKPDEVRTRIVELCGDVPRIELFSRTKFEGWDVWGNQVPEHTQLLLGGKRYGEHHIKRKKKSKEL